MAKHGRLSVDRSVRPRKKACAVSAVVPRARVGGASNPAALRRPGRRTASVPCARIGDVGFAVAACCVLAGRLWSHLAGSARLASFCVGGSARLGSRCGALSLLITIDNTALLSAERLAALHRTAWRLILFAATTAHEDLFAVHRLRNKINEAITKENNERGCVRCGGEQRKGAERT